MATKRFHRGDFVKYDGSIQRFRGTWWTVQRVSTVNDNTSYTLHAPGIGRLHDVRATSVNQIRDQA